MPDGTVPYRRSYRITTSLAAIAAAVCLVLAPALYGFIPASWRLSYVVAAAAAVAIPALIAAAGLLVMRRDSLNGAGKTDLLLAANRHRSERWLHRQPAGQRRSTISLAGLRRIISGGGLIVGDLVEVLSESEINETLDPSGKLDGLPFMPEMYAFCGRQARIYRRVDKIYDYGRTKEMRCLDDGFLLTTFRCDGTSHDGCAAQCHLIWKSAWLKPAAAARATDDGAIQAPPPAPLADASPSGDRCYMCQYTELPRASRPLNPGDIRQDLRPLLSGNITLGAFLVALLTRLFNFVQGRRRGAPYPFISTPDTSSSISVDLGLQKGERVRVLPAAEIGRTLNRNGKNRGLWFDREMIKFCGQTFVVDRRVHRIIDDATGRMLEMRTPCIVLEGVDSSGEFLRFNPQHDQAFWRECWLSRVK